MIIIKHNILDVFRGVIYENFTSVKDFPIENEKRFVKNEKEETSVLLQSLISMKYQGKTHVKEYIIGILNIALKLKALKLEMLEQLLIHLVLISLPSQFGQFKVFYNCKKEKWSFNELISYCVREGEMVF